MTSLNPISFQGFTIRPHRQGFIIRPHRQHNAIGTGRNLAVDQGIPDGKPQGSCGILAGLLTGGTGHTGCGGLSNFG